jgi:hypothetical protein
LLSRVDLPVVNDIAVKDSLVYVACEDDTLRIYSIANPRSPVLVGSCCDSCDLFMTQTGNYCYLVHVSGVNIVDVSNPTSPHRASHIGGGEPLAVYVRDTLCYVTVYQYGLRVWNISDIGSPQLLGSLPGPDALDIGMAETCDTVVYTPTFDVVSVARPANPTLLGHLSGPGGYGVGVVPALGYGLVAASAAGLAAVDIRDPAAPTLDTTAFSAGSVVDIDVAGNRAYLASDRTGMAILDVSNPSQPSLLGRLALPRTNYLCASVVADDSFAFLHWYQVPQFRSIDVSDPTRPTLAGGADVTAPPEDMVLRDSFVYVAEIARFQIVNVARPREPVLVGSCVTQDGVYFGLTVQDTLAYMVGDGFQIVNTARPSAPYLVSTMAGGAAGLAVRDTFAYIPNGWDSVHVYSVADPASPRLISCAPCGVWPWDAALGESKLYVGTSDGWGVDVYDLSNPGQPVRRGKASAASDIRRLQFANGYLYAAMWEAGVAIYETTSTGIGEQAARIEKPRAFRVWPSVTSGNVRFAADGAVQSLDIVVYDVSGKRLRSVPLQANMKGGAAEGEISLAGLPAGVYVVRVDCKGTNLTAKVVRTKGR